MINKLKRKYLVARIVLALCCWGASAVIIFFNADNIRSLFSKPVSLNGLRAEEITEGLHVKGTVTTVIDYYSYMTEDGETTSMEFFIPVGEREFMGLECEGNKMSILKDNIDIFWDSMNEDGTTDTDTAAKLSEVSVNGTIVELTGQSRSFFQQYIDQLNWTDEEKQDFIPYVVKDGCYGDLDMTSWICVGAFAIGLLILGIWFIISGFFSRNLKDVFKYCETQPDKDSALQRIEQFYCMGTPVQGIRANDQYLMAVEGIKVYFTETENIVWAYQNETQHRVNGIPTGKTYSIILWMANGKQMNIGMKGKKAALAAIEYLAKSLPYIYCGYADDLKSYYNSNRNDMINNVRQKRQEMAGQYSDIRYQELQNQEPQV